MNVEYNLILCIVDPLRTCYQLNGGFKINLSELSILYSNTWDKSINQEKKKTHLKRKLIFCF